MSLDLSFQNIILEEVNKENIEALYNFYSNTTFQDGAISKKQFVNNLNDYLDDMIIKCKETLKYHGFCKLIDINYIDRYAYINIFINDFTKNMYINIIYKYINYLFTLYPIRKIYYELYSYEVDIATCLKEVGFNIEVKYKNYKYYNDRYYTKYILVLNRKDFNANE